MASTSVAAPAAGAFRPRYESGGRRAAPPPWHRGYAVLRKLRAALAAAAERHLPVGGNPSAVLLDFGCGDSPYEPMLAPRVGRYLRIDLPGNDRATYTINADGTTTAPAASADVVLSTQVLEHAADPAAYLAEAFRLLKPSGLLLLSTHGYWKYHPDPVDYWRWTGPGLGRLVESAGFRVEGIDGVLGLTAAGLQLVQDGVLPKIPKRLRPAVTLPVQQLILLADRLHTPEYRARDACVFLVTARKPAQ